MIELVLVIVVLGLLAALAMPRLKGDRRQEAADNILSAIRYTQHLALTDDKTDPFDSQWQRKMWRIRFQNSSSTNEAISYVIYSDENKNGNPSISEAAIDPSNGKYFYNQNANSVVDSQESPNVFIGKKYGIKPNGVILSGGCSGFTHIAFDSFGRPYSGIDSANDKYSKYMTADCKITFKFIDSDISDLVIVIQKETGYAYIVGEPNS